MNADYQNRNEILSQVSKYFCEDVRTDVHSQILKATEHLPIGQLETLVNIQVQDFEEEGYPKGSLDFVDYISLTTTELQYHLSQNGNSNGGIARGVSAFSQKEEYRISGENYGETKSGGYRCRSPNLDQI